MNVLLIAGHGAGDPGATATTNGSLHKEADETRKVVAALQKALRKYCNTTVYPTSRNAFDDHKKGVLTSTAKFANYGYVLEIHFNAFQNGPLDGKTKGVECFVTSRESGTTVEEKICKNIASVGLTNRGVKRYNWSVINAAKNAGVSSALLEVCFIDDPDDMKVYTQKFQQIVDGIAKGIVDGFGLGEFKAETETNKEEIDMTVDQVNALVDQRIKKFFDDLAKDETLGWAKEAVEYVKANGIMTGYTNGKFRPKDFVTREELAQTIYNADKRQK